MSIQFEDSQYTARHSTRQPKGLTGWFIKAGIVKSEDQASLLMAGISILCLVTTAVIAYRTAAPERIDYVQAEAEANDFDIEYAL